MRYRVAACIIVAGLCLALMVLPRLEEEVQARLPLLSAYYISRQLKAEISSLNNRTEAGPPSYSSLISQYENVAQHPDFVALTELSAAAVNCSALETPLVRLILWRKVLPHDLMTANPVAELNSDLNELRAKERNLEAARSRLIERHVIECLKQRPAHPVEDFSIRGSLPSAMVEEGFYFCGEKIPLERPDVRQRIEYQLNYLLGDFRETTGMWLRRKDRYAGVIEAVLRTEGVPAEFHLLPALESGYKGAAVSPALATGWWQFVRPTATGMRGPDKKLDWTLQIKGNVDQRKDIVLSTRSAARYLTWMRSKLDANGDEGSWLTAAAAYNAGFDEVRHRMSAYGTPCFWDMKLPLETENYVPRWIALSIIDAHRQLYQVEGTTVSPLTFDTLEDVRLAKDVPLTLIATLTDSSVRFIRELNGALGRGESKFRAAGAGGDPGVTIHVPAGTRDMQLGEFKSRGYIKDPE